MLRYRLKTILFRMTIVLSLLFTLGIAWSANAFLDLEQEMITKLETKKFISPTEIYSAPAALVSGLSTSPQDAQNLLSKYQFRQRTDGQILLKKDFRILNSPQCSDEWSLSAFACIALKDEQNRDVLFVFKDSTTLAQIYINNQKAESFDFPPRLIAQYLGAQPVLHESASMAEIPALCSNAVMAIEDQQFLEHSGVSFKGIFRALSRNLIEGRKAQGASTITQQLVKNYFLTAEKTYSRKAREIAMALMLETRFNKDQILETYLNIIYMGQSGAYQVKGFKSAARHYFDKDLSKLNLAECSLLAAIINSPGIYNPFKNPDKAIKRRQLVLAKMLELNLISQRQKEEAEKQALPKVLPTLAVETAPYYVEAVRKQISTLNLPWEGLKIYTGLNLEAQAQAQNALIKKLEQLEAENKTIKKNKEQGLTLQGSLLSVSSKTGLIEVAVGGRDFKKTQFNRATEAKRQIGSIMKPFVFLTAFEHGFTPDSIVEDKTFTYKWQGQSWTPQNYDKKTRGPVSLTEALKLSLNIPTAKIGIESGLENVISTANFFGLESRMEQVPSLTLGAFEMSHLEVLRAYTGLSTIGEVPSLSFISKIYSQEDKVLWEPNKENKKYANPDAVLKVVKILEEATQTGTSAAIGKSGFIWKAAGKTGTTSDYKDAWFAGFTPEITTLVWMGYDNNTPHRLTGASGPVGVWLDYMNFKMKPFPVHDFEKKSEAP